MAHSPKPWRPYRDRHDRTYIADAAGNHVADISNADDASVISASLELAEVARAYLTVWSLGGDPSRGPSGTCVGANRVVYYAARVALAKADHK